MLKREKKDKLEERLDKVVGFLNSDERTSEGSKNVIIMLLVAFIILLVLAFLFTNSGSYEDTDPDCIAPEAAFNACY